MFTSSDRRDAKRGTFGAFASTLAASSGFAGGGVATAAGGVGEGGGATGFTGGFAGVAAAGFWA